MKATATYIYLNGLKFYAYHGVLPQENKVGAEYTVDVRLSVDFSEAARTDNLKKTINYADVFELIKIEMQIPSLLIEHLSYRIAQKLLQSFPSLREVKINLYKQNPPIGANCSQIGIEAIYERL